jgi:hypothetical protein
VPVIARTMRRAGDSSARRRVGFGGCVLMALAALLVPVGSAAGEPTQGSTAGPTAAEGRAPAGGDVASLENDIERVLSTSPGAVRTGTYEVSWDDGAVVSTWVPKGSVDRGGALTARDADTTSSLTLATSVGGCPDGTTVHWYCFYEHASFGGRMLQFRDCPSTQSLGYYGFANQTTSWVNNRSGVTITVYDGSTSGTVLWREYGRSSDSNVGTWANDRADTFTCRT